MYVRDTVRHREKEEKENDETQEQREAQRKRERKERGSVTIIFLCTYNNFLCTYTYFCKDIPVLFIYGKVAEPFACTKGITNSSNQQTTVTNFFLFLLSLSKNVF